MKNLNRFAFWFYLAFVAAAAASAFGQFITVDPAVEFSTARLQATKPMTTDIPGVCFADRKVTVWPTTEALALYVAYAPLPAGTAYQAMGFPFVVDQRLDAFPRLPTPWGDWRGTWPTLGAIVNPTIGPDLFTVIDLPIPPGAYAVQAFLWRKGEGILTPLVAIK